MKTRIISAAILLPIFALILWVLPKAICAITVAVLCAFMAYELLKRTGLVPHTRLLIYSMLAAFMVPIWSHLGMSRPWGQLGLLLFFSAIFGEMLYNHVKVRFEMIGFCVLAGLILPYMLSAIVQKYTGEKLTEYLYPRLFRPLGINNVSWAESPQGINTGGWGLYLKTEDLAKMGQMLLQKGKFNGKQVVPQWWVEEASSAQVQSVPAGINSEMISQLPKNSRKTSDWLQGYGYQMWRCRNNAFRADGANGQYIIMIPDKNAVVVTTADISDMQEEINLIWKHILPAL